jgi:release factor glutamine methyltransferase
MDLSVAGALAEARAAGVDRLDAQLLLSATLGRTRAWLIANDDVALEDAQAQSYRGALRRRAAGEPLAYLLGEKEFHGLSLQVTRDVLVPRPDTETLVEWALALLGGAMASLATPQVVDLGTGSGAIALALKHRLPEAQVTAVDTSAAALAVARSNGDRLGLPIDWRHGDWWQAVPGRRFDLAVSNPPYIAEGDAHLAALTHEPPLALSSGADGLDAIREIIAGAPAQLNDGGWLLLEHGHDQAERVTTLLSAAGFSDVTSRTDLAGITRCTGGCWRLLASVAVLADTSADVWFSSRDPANE